MTQNVGKFAKLNKLILFLLSSNLILINNYVGCVAINENNVELPDSNCGTPIKVIGKISKGKEIEHGALPWLAAIFKILNKNDHKLRYMCGGTLISPSRVVSAAHCFFGKLSNKLEYHELIVYLGAHKTNSQLEDRRSLRVKSIEIHPTWSSTVDSYKGDIAFLELAKSVEYSDFIRPICLFNYSTTVKDGINGTVAGWGRTETGDLSDEPRKIEIPIVEKSKCYEIEPNLAKAGWDKSFCAGRENSEVGVCDGDSGSGFYILVNGKYFLKGVVSSAVLANDDMCANHFALYADVTKYHDFLTGVNIDVKSRIDIHDTTTGANGLVPPTIGKMNTILVAMVVVAFLVTVAAILYNKVKQYIESRTVPNSCTGTEQESENLNPIINEESSRWPELPTNQNAVNKTLDTDNNGPNANKIELGWNLKSPSNNGINHSHSSNNIRSEHPDAWRI